MMPPLPQGQLLVLDVGLLGACVIALMAFFRGARRSGVAWGLITLVSGSMALAVMLWFSRSVAWICFGVAVTAVAIPVLAALAASIPLCRVTGLVAERVISKPTSPSRRAFVQVVTVLPAVAALGTVAKGFIGGECAAITPTLRFDVPSLGAERLRILHLSDLHLGCTRSVDDLERLFESLANTPFDMIAVTGDVAEDVRLLAPALRILSAQKPRLGSFACLGNHEYYRGVEEARAVFERSDVHLLVDAHGKLRIGNATVVIAGIDDPIFVHTEIHPFLRDRLDRALDGAPSDALTLLLSHRPEGLVAASDRDVGLVLSGHTHGGQIGFNGKAAFEPLFPDGYLWGKYRRGNTLAYTTSGFGEWYPFRLGCPSEAPILELSSRG